jgi:predicted dehydrogenase
MLAQIYYYAGRPRRDASKPGMDPGHARLLNWLTDKTLSGDIIVEQNIHVLDLANWYLQGHPVKAYGTGGRADWTGTPYNTGDAWDHFVVTYTYPGGTKGDFSSNQLTGSYNSLTVRCFGTKGAADTNYGGGVRITGENAWTGAEKDDTFTQGAVTNIKNFIESVRTGAYINNAESAVESTLTCILGRTAAYQNREVTWDEMLKRNERYEANLKLTW